MPLTKLALSFYKYTHSSLLQKVDGRGREIEAPQLRALSYKGSTPVITATQRHCGFLQWKLKNVVPRVSVPVAGLQPRMLVLRLRLSTGLILQIQFSVCPRHLASHSSSVCNGKAGLTWPLALMEVLQSGTTCERKHLHVDTGVCIIIISPN